MKTDGVKTGKNLWVSELFKAYWTGQLFFKLFDERANYMVDMDIDDCYRLSRQRNKSPLSSTEPRKRIVSC